jgi:molybdopterin synthase sulfur carrier subunit
MKKVRVLYFAALRDLTGRQADWLDLPPETATVGAALVHLQRVRPELDGRLGSVRAALNETFVALTDPIADADTLALIPPVSGG